MATSLKDLLAVLYEAGAEDVPADETGWTSDMTPALVTAINMGYVRYRDRGDVRYFSLTKVGYDAIGIAPPDHSPWGLIRAWFSSLFGRQGS